MKEFFKLVYERVIKGCCSKDYWIQPFPEYYAPECFDCNRGDCIGCQYK